MVQYKFELFYLQCGLQNVRHRLLEGRVKWFRGLIYDSNQHQSSSEAKFVGLQDTRFIGPDSLQRLLQPAHQLCPDGLYICRCRSRHRRVKALPQSCQFFLSCDVSNLEVHFTTGTTEDDSLGSPDLR